MTDKNHRDDLNDPAEQSPEHEKLVAYLDGELDHQEAQQLETELANDPALRKQLQDLQRTWDMLDHLPTNEVDNSFTRSTIEMVLGEARKEYKVTKKRNWRRLKQCGLGIAVLTISTLIGYMSARHIYETPRRELIQNLDFYRNVDNYGNISDIELLEKLDQEALMPDALDSEDLDVE